MAAAVFPLGGAIDGARPKSRPTADRSCRPGVGSRRRVAQSIARPLARPTSPAATSARTYRRRRLVVAVFASGVLVAAAWLVLARLGGGPLSASEPPSLRTVSTRTYVVQPGDTMWDIARRVEPDRDPRPVIDALVAARGHGPLRVGERIPLP